MVTLRGWAVSYERGTPVGRARLGGGVEDWRLQMYLAHMLKMMRTRRVLLLALLGFKAARIWGRAPHGKIVPSDRNRRYRTRVCASSEEGLETRQGSQRIQRNTHAAAVATRSIRLHSGIRGVGAEHFHHLTEPAPPPAPPNPPASRTALREKVEISATACKLHASAAADGTIKQHSGGSRALTE